MAALFCFMHHPLGGRIKAHGAEKGPTLDYLVAFLSDLTLTSRVSGIC